jgi:hypothetical protein
LKNSKSDTESDNQSVISADFYFNSNDDEEHHGAILMTSDAADTNIPLSQSFQCPAQLEQLKLPHDLLTNAAQDQV